MEFSTTTVSAPDIPCDSLVVGVFQDGTLSPAAKAVDRRTDGAITAALADHKMAGKAGSVQALYRLDGVAARQVLLAGLGDPKKPRENDFRIACVAAARFLHAGAAQDVAIAALEWPVGRRSATWKARQLAMMFGNATYRYDATKPSAQKARKARRPIVTVAVALPAAAGRAAVGRALDEGAAIAAGQLLTRELGNLPANICTPGYLEEQARALARGDKRFKVSVMNTAAMQRKGMGALLAVAQGSPEPPKLITIEYRGGKRSGAPIALVGKGVTFDTGGISIKPSPAMDEMKFDMCGAGSVLGTLKACAAMGLPQRVIGVIPATENMPSGTATRPGDVVTTASGQTVEILNTDAEGRLILCDALTHALTYKPRIIIDIATLTGACAAALGKHASGLFTPDEKLRGLLMAAAQESWDRLWPLPMWDDYQRELDSNFADIANIGKRYAGATTAACFLSRFVKGHSWAHLDIAGTAWNSGPRKGATGRPVPLLAHFLLKDAGRRL